jgi:hypothetical protein
MSCPRCGKVTRDGDVHTCSPKGLPHCENSCEANAFKIEIRRLKAEKKELLEALKLALSAHGVMLMSDPPQEAWKTYGVEQKARAAIAKAEAA